MKPLNVHFSILLISPFIFPFVVFTRCGAHEQALSSFQKSANWRQVFCMASLLHYTGEQVISLARTVAGMQVILLLYKYASLFFVKTSVVLVNVFISTILQVI